MPYLIGISVITGLGVLLALIILGTGRFRATQSPPGGSRLPRVLLETLALYLLSFVPVAALLVFPGLEIPGLDAEQRHQFTGGLLTLTRLSHLFLLPVWFAARLPNMAHRASGFALRDLLLSILSYLALLIVGGTVASLLLAGPNLLELYFNLALGGASTVGFVLVYCLIGVVVLAAHRSLNRHTAGTCMPTRPGLRLALSAALLGSFFVWLAVLSISLRDRPDLLFDPPPLLDLAESLSLTPVSQLEWVSWFSLVLPLIILFSGLLATYHGKSDASLLFGLLCLLQLVWGLDSYPRWGGGVFWALDLLAGSLMLPVLIHLFLQVPEGAVRLPPTARRVLASLYSVFALAGLGLLLILWREIPTTLPQGNTHPALIPVAAMTPVILLLSTPVVWCLSLYSVWSAGSLLRALPRSPAAGTGCRWLDRLALQSNAAGEREREQARFVARSLVVVTVALIVWLIFLPLWLTPRFEVLGNILIKIWVASFYILILASIVRHRLWGLGKVTAVALAFSLLLVALRGVKSLGLSLLTNALVVVLGLFAFPVVEWFTFRLVPTSWLYRRLFAQRYQWQSSLGEATEALAEPGAGGDVIDRSLETACAREGAYGAWLLARKQTDRRDVFELVRLAHGESCTGACEPRLSEVLGKGAGTGFVSLDDDLLRALDAARKRREAIEIHSELKRETRRGALRRLPWLGPRCAVLNLAALDALCLARVSLLLPFGGGAVTTGVLVLLGEVEPGEYDARDHRALSAYSKEMSIAMTLRRWPVRRPSLTGRPAAEE